MDGSQTKRVVDDMLSMSTFNSVSAVQEICSPLKYLAVDLFCYYEKYPDNTILILINQPQILECWAENPIVFHGQDPFLHKVTHVPGWHFWEPFLSNPRLADAISLLKHFKFTSGASFVEWEGDTKKIYHFTSEKKALFSYSLLNSINLFNRFIYSFRRKVRHLAFKNNRYLLPKEVVHHLETETISESIVQSVQRRERQFLEEMDEVGGPLELFGDQYKLTRRERQCLEGLMQGAASKKIAYDLHVSVRTVESHFQSIREKTGCRTKIDIILKMQNVNEVAAALG